MKNISQSTQRNRRVRSVISDFFMYRKVRRDNAVYAALFRFIKLTKLSQGLYIHSLRSLRFSSASAILNINGA
jgi:hypothetical protein